MQTRSILLGAVAALGLSLAAGAIETADAQGGGSARTLLRCRALGGQQTSMHARYDARRTRQKFSVEAQANPPGGSGIVAGSVMTVTVDGQPAGTEVFAPVTNGHLVADLNLDTKPNGPDTKPFPADLIIQTGSDVVVTINTNPVRTMACELH